MSSTSNTDAAATIDIARNLQEVQDRVNAAAAAAAASTSSTSDTPVRLVAVSKTKPIELLQAAYDAGCRTFGENYVQELVEKVPQLPDDTAWHFIGALQSNKAKQLVTCIPDNSNINRLTVETVSSVKLANKLQNAVAQHFDSDTTKNDQLNVMVQVNTSGEDSKSGVEPGEECVALCQHIVQNCPRLKLTGLMTIGAPGDVSCFQVLNKCRQQVLLAQNQDSDTTAASHLELSMGMSGDFEAAIAAGATNVRVGSTIFGARDYSQQK